tara:strand:+ start:11731 stop:12393 length:663 start_codon:yes stop_codon:yes gene_type:complete
MNNSGGALLTEVYGSDSIKVKKKDKRKKELRYLPENKGYLYPEQLEKVELFDKHFHEKSNIMPFGTHSEDNYSPIDQEKKTQGTHFPYDSYTLDGHRKPSPPTVKEEPPTLEPPPPQPIPPTEKGEVPSKVYEQPPKHWAWDKGVKISHQEYKEFQDFKKFKANQQIEIIQQQREKSQEATKESFSNINDDFNDVLLFGLLGIFFLIFTDYVYKLGRKSY